jgi:glycosyltransferase involved in cell wall biosynthesis
MSRKYKILLSAYACEPNRGSEPGVGWNWALELCKLNHDVWVITRANNKTVIDDYLDSNQEQTNLHFIYYDLPHWLLWLKKYGLSVNLYYLFWQFGIVSSAKKQHEIINFDLVHHITFGVFRHPSFLYKLKIPLVFGPVGGGEYTPNILRKIFPLKNRFTESIRGCINKISKYNPLLNRAYENSVLILTKTAQTKEYVPEKFQYKTKNLLEIGIKSVSVEELNTKDNLFRVLFVGRLIYSKGLDVALSAFAKFSNSFNGESVFDIVGEGEYKNRIEKLAIKYGIEDKVKIIEWMPQEKLKDIYLSSNVLLFPSLHDSSGNVVLEALSFGLPVVCLDCGGPAAVLGEKFNDLIVPTHNVSRDIIEQNLADKLSLLANDKVKFEFYSNRAKMRAQELTWEGTVKSAYDEISMRLKNYND